MQLTVFHFIILLIGSGVIMTITYQSGYQAGAYDMEQNFIAQQSPTQELNPSPAPAVQYAADPAPQAWVEPDEGNAYPYEAELEPERKPTPDVYQDHPTKITRPEATRVPPQPDLRRRLRQRPPVPNSRRMPLGVQAQNRNYH